MTEMSSQSEELLHSVQGLPRQEREELLSGKSNYSQTRVFRLLQGYGLYRLVLLFVFNSLL